MRKIWKKGMAGALSLCMATTCMPGVSELGSFVHTMKTVEAETTENVLSGTCGEKATWEYDPATKTLTIGGSGDIESNLEYYYDDEYAILESPWYRYKNEIKKVVIGDEITYIGIGCFYGCIALEEVKFGKKLEKIDEKAFVECTSLKKLELSGIYDGSDNQALWDEVYAYLNAVYDLGKVKKIYLNADGGAWIKAGKNRIAGITYVLDEFHLNKYILRATSHMLDSQGDAVKAIK